MRIWIDLSNSPHVPFFLALSEEFTSRGHEILWTARDYAQTVELAREAGLDVVIFGTHGGKSLAAKGVKFIFRIFELLRWTRGKKIGLVVVHNSQEPLIVARMLGIDSVNLMDYEHHPGNHISFRTAKRLVVPKSFPAESLNKFGASASKVRWFDGIKEDVYLADFKPDENFANELLRYGIRKNHILIVVRPHAPEALYHRSIENELLNRVLDKFAASENVKIILLPRKDYQGEELRKNHPHENIIIPKTAINGANLIAAADLVVSGGGTMNREAAALGVPTATIFSGREAAIDEYLISEGGMRKIGSVADLDTIPIEKKGSLRPRMRHDVRKRVADLILGFEDWEENA